MLANSVRPNEPPTMSVVGRQAILDRRGDVAAYELLYRRSESATSAVVLDDMSATATVMVNAVVELGLDAVAGTKDIFVNCSADVLALPLDELLPALRVVLEVLETVDVSAELVERIQELRRIGFRVALDDYVLRDPRGALLEVVDLVKVDLSQVSLDEMPALVKELAGFRGELLAEKVESMEDFERCKELGFDLFQGYFFCRPNVVSRRAASDEQQNLLEILVAVQRSDASLDEVVEVIQRNLGVSYRLLRCLNSVVFGLRQPVDSLRQALILLGMPRVRAWVSLMAISSVKGKSTEVLRLAMVRAAMCQELASVTPGTEKESMFTTGMFSMLDTMLDMEMDDIVSQLPLGPTVRGALLGEGSASRDLLCAVVAYERGHFAQPDGHSQRLDEMGAAWLAAVSWTEEITAALIDA